MRAEATALRDAVIVAMETITCRTFDATTQVWSERSSFITHSFRSMSFLMSFMRGSYAEPSRLKMKRTAVIGKIVLLTAIVKG